MSVNVSRDSKAEIANNQVKFTLHRVSRVSHMLTLHTFEITEMHHSPLFMSSFYTMSLENISYRTIMHCVT